MPKVGSHIKALIPFLHPFVDQSNPIQSPLMAPNSQTSLLPPPSVLQPTSASSYPLSLNPVLSLLINSNISFLIPLHLLSSSSLLVVATLTSSPFYSPSISPLFSLPLSLPTLNPISFYLSSIITPLPSNTSTTSSLPSPLIPPPSPSLSPSFVLHLPLLSPPPSSLSPLSPVPTTLLSPSLSLFNSLLSFNLSPDATSYHSFMLGLCRKS